MKKVEFYVRRVRILFATMTKESFWSIMRNMKKGPFFVALAVSFGLLACTPPEEEVHPKRRSARADNLQRYVNKAQEYRAFAQARSKPVVQGGLVDSSVLNAFLPKTQDLRVSSQIFAQKNLLESVVREKYTREALEQVESLLNQMKEQIQPKILAAQSAKEVAAAVNEITDLYAKKLADFSQSQEQIQWTGPDVEQSRLSRQTLQEAVHSLLENIALDYGNECAEKTKPVLQKAADDYWLVLSSVNNRQDMEQELIRVGRGADAAFNRVIVQYGDPMLSVSEAQAASLRVQLIEAQQEIESQFEKLYGKDAVLQTREIFENYKNNLEQILQKPARLSRMQEAFNREGEVYRQEMLELQVRLNEDLERRSAEVRGIPVSVAAK